MKKILFLITLAFSSMANAFSETDLVQLLQQPQSVQGEFVQARYLKALNNPITTAGKFSLITSKGLLWQMEKPFDNQLRVNQAGVMQWNGKDWVANNQIGQGEQIRLFLGLFSGDLAQLKQQFKLDLKGNQNQWQLTLLPDSLLMKQIFNQIVISGNQSLERIELNEVQGDRTEIRFSQQKLNAPLSDFAKQALQ